jgi:hypothetical protein
MHPGRAQALIRPDAARGLLPSTPPNPPMTPDSKFGAGAEVEARHEAEAGSLDRFAVFRREVLYCPARDLPLAAARSNASRGATTFRGMQPSVPRSPRAINHTHDRDGHPPQAGNLPAGAFCSQHLPRPGTQPVDPCRRAASPCMASAPRSPRPAARLRRASRASPTPAARPSPNGTRATGAAKPIARRCDRRPHNKKGACSRPGPRTFCISQPLHPTHLPLAAGATGGTSTASFCNSPAIVDSAPNARSNFAVTPSAPKAVTSAVRIAPVVVALSPVAVPMVPSVCKIHRRSVEAVPCLFLKGTNSFLRRRSLWPHPGLLFQQQRTDRVAWFGRR